MIGIIVIINIDIKSMLVIIIPLGVIVVLNIPVEVLWMIMEMLKLKGEVKEMIEEIEKGLVDYVKEMIEQEVKGEVE